VTDPFTAIVLGGLLERLLARGAVVVATSNKAPRELNQYGMQGELFEKFVQRLEDNCEILRVGTGVDYRRVLASAAGDLVARQEVRFQMGVSLTHCFRCPSS
jgi:predicted ATPase